MPADRYLLPKWRPVSADPAAAPLRPRPDRQHPPATLAPNLENEELDPPLLYYHGSGGSERGWHSTHWLWGLPPPGPLAFACQWPGAQLATSGVEIDASWSWRPPSEPYLSGRRAKDN